MALKLVRMVNRWNLRLRGWMVVALTRMTVRVGVGVCEWECESGGLTWMTVRVGVGVGERRANADDSVSVSVWVGVWERRANVDDSESVRAEGLFIEMGRTLWKFPIMEIEARQFYRIRIRIKSKLYSTEIDSDAYSGIIQPVNPWNQLLFFFSLFRVM